MEIFRMKSENYYRVQDLGKSLEADHLHCLPGDMIRKTAKIQETEQKKFSHQ